MFIKSVFKQPLVAGANTLSYGIGNQDDLWLLGANLEEVDASDNPQPDSGSIWIQDTQLDNSISLCHGGMRNGQLSGFGAMPLPRGSEIVGKLWHSRAGYTGKLNLQISRLSDMPGGIHPVWSQGAVAQNSIPRGKLKLYTLTGAATVTTVDLRPDDGYIWEVIEALASHDDPAPRTITWSYYDGTTRISKMASINKTVDVPHSLAALGTANSEIVNTCFGRPVATYDTYISATASALDPGKKLTVEAVVLEYAE